MEKIGDFVLGRVVKALPDRDSYLILINGTQPFAVLPKQYADRPYRVKDTISAAVYRLGEVYPVLSQRCPHYIRRISESILRPVMATGEVRIRRVATGLCSPFVKIAVESDEGVDPVRLCVPYRQSYASYTRLMVSFVRYSTDLGRFIRNALAPAPVDRIRRIDVFREEQMARVLVPAECKGYFLGKGGMNVALASKLTSMAIELRTEP